MNAPDPFFETDESAGDVPNVVLQAEQSVLGLLIRDGAPAYDMVSGLLSADSFQNALHQVIWSTVEGLVLAGEDVDTIVVMEKSFHGRTMATLSATGNRKIQAGFEPLVAGFLRVPYNDLAAIREVAQHNKSIVAVMYEAVQGEGGIHMADLDFQRGVRQLCDENAWLMICDEVQCGIGRTGPWFGFQHAGIVPDVATLAKGLAGGVPVGACLASGKAAGLFGPGNHGTTFGGNQLAMTAALTTLDVVEKEGLRESAVRIGQLIRDELKTALAGVAGVVDIRGNGLMIGIELDRPCGAIVQKGLEAGVLINVTADCVVRLLPALNFGEDDAHELVARLAKLIRAFLAG